MAETEGAGLMTEDQAGQIITLLEEIRTLQYWQLAAVCFVAGILPIISFFIGKGDR